MLTRSTTGSGANTSSKSDRSKQATGLPFLKAEHLSTEKRALSILGARAERDRWDNPSVLMKVRYDGKLFLWQVNDKSPNFDLLIDILGDDEAKWVGNDVIVYLEQDELTTRYYPRVEKVAATAKKK
jgi:hypothetical protein